ncbi:hypothetical protein ABK040_015882 [Willaertia magna]
MVRHIKLNNGHSIPQIGLGTWQSERNEVSKAITVALEKGYRHIDCAAIYGNEDVIGKAIQNYLQQQQQNNTRPIKREDLFITSKLWNTCHRKEHVKGACKETLKNLKLTYLDLYLIHWPLAFPFNDENIRDEKGGFVKLDNVPLMETWKAMEELVDEGLVRSIGISNFTSQLILDLNSYARIKPAILQNECHPYLNQKDLIKLCKQLGIVFESYSPLGHATVLNDEIIAQIAQRHKKSVGQIVLRWNLQLGNVIIPKSTNPSRIEENLNILDFELTDKEMNKISSLEEEEGKKIRTCDPLDFGWGWNIFC